MDGQGPTKYELELSNTDLGIETTPKLISPVRVDNKVNGAIALLSNLPGFSSEKVRTLIDQKVKKLEESITLMEPTIILDPNEMIGQVLVDEHGRPNPGNFKNPESSTRLITDYIATEAAISVLYSSTTEILTLPPEAFKLDIPIAQRLDQNGIYFYNVGISSGEHKVPNLKTRLYSIPGQQLDQDKHPIPLYKQKILVVQEVPIGDGRFQRNFQISDLETINVESENIIKKQTPDQSEEEITQPQKIEAPTPSSIEPNNQQPDEKTLKTLDYVNKVADAVISGRTNPTALQNYVQHAISQGVSKDEIEKVLVAKGIQVERRDQEQQRIQELRYTVLSVIKRLQENPVPGYRLDGFNINPNEKSAIIEYANLTLSKLRNDPRLDELQNIITPLARNDATFNQRHLFGRTVVEDPSITKIKVVNTESGPVIKVPTETYQIWMAKGNAENAIDLVNNQYGRTTTNFERKLTGLTNYLK